MKYITYLIPFLWGSIIEAQPLTKVIVAVQRTELSDKNKPLRSGVYNTWRIRYKIKNMSNGKFILVHQNKDEKVLNLSEGNYCFYGMMHSRLNDGEYLPILNPKCFSVFGSVPINTGTWVIGERWGRSGKYMMIINHKENYKELARKLSINEYKVTTFSIPKK